MYVNLLVLCVTVYLFHGHEPVLSLKGLDPTLFAIFLKS